MLDLQPPFTNLQLVQRVDSWPYFTKDPEAYRTHMKDYHYFLIDGYDKPFGYVHNHFSEVAWPEYWEIDAEKRFLTLRAAGASDFKTRSEHVLNLDGCGVDMFGIVNYSVHLISWVMNAEGMKIWVPRRAMTKMSFPGMLDNTVGGSLAAGERPIDGIVREC
ncbi:hypothetical protein B0T26DRAFT_749274 [Lasiosphaeria miniovina]|uniref:Uncharacterized protein n=1 Tax=Lasiosphaeria miniovina TaxID=1954250 RepID=A0AA40E2H6_9PEZI|nr:uncharacterized protein B0T26DRAFT_749274 [Lasiosphaeria miniovina]KAK0721791.1 hypothetical protein B0T26DRAFT_749274 [Lasiosphaeria miniovina]